MKSYFIIKEMPHNLRNGCALKLPSANSTYYEIKCGIGYHSRIAKSVTT